MKFELNEDTAVLVAVGTATILVLGMVAYTAMQPKPTEHFFALYLLGPFSGGVQQHHLSRGDHVQCDGRRLPWYAGHLRLVHWL